MSRGRFHTPYGPKSIGVRFGRNKRTCRLYRGLRIYIRICLEDRDSIRVLLYSASEHRCMVSSILIYDTRISKYDPSCLIHFTTFAFAAALILCILRDAANMRLRIDAVCDLSPGRLTRVIALREHRTAWPARVKLIHFTSRFITLITSVC